ncbi:ubiquitin-protein ligase E3A [Anopheles maculipalpis]|uniref:ubiquitin-protein ligase E3A n=1 Tax=Anopheles maculipalpis TaxID=1496333 RepID=UPI002158B016|nr:ubiquitin-protein ligase E3A [Anopheles maculipalpis]
MNSAQGHNPSDDDSRIDEEPSSSSGSQSCGKDEESSTKKSTKQSNYSVPPASSSSSVHPSAAASSVGPQPGSRTGSGLTTNDQAAKQESVKKLIERYFYQLMQGCGNTKCCNKNCASSGKVGRLTPNAAAARAIQLYSQEADLCYEMQTTNTTKKDNQNNAACSSSFPLNTSSAQGTSESFPSPGHQSNVHADQEMDAAYDNSAFDIDSIDEEVPLIKIITAVEGSCSSSKLSGKTNSETEDEIPYLDERKLQELTERCMVEGSKAPLIDTLFTVFSSYRSLAASFQFCPASSSIEKMLARAPAGDLRNIKKEDLRSLEGDLDKDEDSKAPMKSVSDVPDPAHTTVDVESLRRALKALHAASPEVFGPINEALGHLGLDIALELNSGSTSHEVMESLLTVIVIVFETLLVGSADCLEGSFPRFCAVVSRMPVWAQCRLVRIWAEHCKDSIYPLVILLQQLLTVNTLMITYKSMRINDCETICNATMVFKLVYYANILAGELEPKHYRERDVRNQSLQAYTYLSLIPEEDDMPVVETDAQSRQRRPEDPLAEELDVNPLDCRKPLVPYEEFYNENLCDAMEVEFDYMAYKHLHQHRPSAENGGTSGTDRHEIFSFIHYPFVMTPTTKTLALYFDSRIRMFSERRLSYLHRQRQLACQLHSTSDLQTTNPYLNLKIRRDHIIEDALVELEIIAMSNPKDLKKQLVVEFTGEQGIDEGGVSKEFFQLIIEEIFNPDFGMFMTNEDSNTVWFNPVSFENEAQFTLIGIVLGLAIYNNIILAVNFPMVVYRKLMGMKGSFLDLKDQNPVLFNSLKSLLEYTENDMEEVFIQTFKIAYRDVFGTILEHELKPNGDQIFVTQDNKQEFVELYSDFMLNKSVEKQFNAFSNGFQMVTSESLLHLLFRPEELELIVCGSKNFDFNELELSTEYQGGFERDSATIKHFWSIVHGLSMEMKRKLLQFTTGSDRVPVGGLSRLKLVIARNGPDSDRLPTSHTCFNVLLLPEYSSKEKLEERLLKAINYSKGFGML